MTDPNSVESRIARMEESDFEYFRERRTRHRLSENQLLRVETENEVEAQLDAERREALARMRRKHLFQDVQARIESESDKDRNRREQGWG